MNILLFAPEEVDGSGHVSVSGRRALHIKKVLDAGPEDTLRAGMLGGQLGEAKVVKVEDASIKLYFVPQTEPPEPIPVKLVLALPRPKVLKRVIANIVSLGIKEIYLINAFRVEKPYWSSEQVKLDYIREACLLGLEQARDTVLPKISMERLFKPFVQDRLPLIIKGTRALVGHPGAEAVAPKAINQPVTLVVGPEGGFIPYEVQLLMDAGVEPVSLGERILKVETALTYFVGRLGI